MEFDLFMRPEARIMVEIRKYNEKGGDIYFSKLRDLLGDSYSPVTITKCIKKLEDQGLLRLEWEQLEGEEAEKLGNRWVRKIYVSEEATELVELLGRTQKAASEMNSSFR